MYFMFIMQCPKIQDKESVVRKVHIKYGATYPSITIVKPVIQPIRSKNIYKSSPF